MTFLANLFTSFAAEVSGCIVLLFAVAFIIAWMRFFGQPHIVAAREEEERGDALCTESEAAAWSAEVKP